VAALVKPQFEVGPGGTDKGVVRDEAARRAAVDGVLAFCTATLGLAFLGEVPSRIKGPKGNQE
jgi:23S rRNA (cytidine1920-2'-O)/16S rRNA (cytidine1409-2'-O)-methyltransferase